MASLQHDSPPILSEELPARGCLPASKKSPQTILDFVSSAPSIWLCIDEALVAKAAENRAPRYIESLGYYLRQFARGRDSAPIDGFTFLDVETWLAGYKNADTKRAWISRLSALFAFAVTEMRKCPLKTGPVTPSNSTVRRWRWKMTAMLGLEKWPQDFLRHTAASYLYERTCDAAVVAKWLGNSEKVLMSTYVVPVTRQDCEAFWNFAPAGRTSPALTPESALRTGEACNVGNGLL